MLITIIFLLLLLLLGGFIIVRIRRQDQQATPRRHQRQPHLSHEHNMNHDVNDALGLSEASKTQLEVKEPAIPAAKTNAKPTEYLVLHVMAPLDYTYNGYELLQSLLANGLRYGEMNIFHRHETKTGRGSILFSLASVNKPGTFELPKMGSFSCPGLTLFMPLKASPDPMIAFDSMLETAKQLVEDLGGEIWDENRQVLNMDKITHMRTKIRQFEKNQRTPDFFAELQPD